MHPTPLRSETVRLIRLFISSPTDCQTERDLIPRILDRINQNQASGYGVRLESVRCEDDVVPQIGPPAQDVVDRQTPAYGIYLGILKARFGKATARFGSGTEQEFQHAFDAWSRLGQPWILFYFADGIVVPGDDEHAVEQFLQIVKFRKRLYQKGFVASFPDTPDGHGFEQAVEHHLRLLLKNHFADFASPRLPPSDEVRPIVPETYRAWLKKESSRIELLGVPRHQGQALRLSHVYVPLTTTWVERLDDAPPRPSRTQGAPTDEKTQSHSVLLDLLGKHSLYVPGAPGSGKSTFCRWVALVTCLGQLPDQTVSPPQGYAESFPSTLLDRLPLLVPLRDFYTDLPDATGRRSLSRAELETSLAAWLKRSRANDLSWEVVAAHLRAGTALLILDGVDEVPPAPRELLLSGLTDAAGPWQQAGNRLLVTSRPYGLTDDHRDQLGLATAEIRELDRPLLELLIARWFTCLNADQPDDGQQKTRDMLVHLDERWEELSPLAASPMLVSAMCTIFDQGGRLPHDKQRLYQAIVDNVLHNRFLPDKIDMARARLEVIAYGMHTGKGLGDRPATPLAEVTRKEIDRILQDFRDTRDWKEHDVREVFEQREELLSHSGLLLPVQHDKAAFYHLTLQDFLAAQRLLDVDRERLAEVCLERAETPQWRATLSFVFGSLVYPRVSELSTTLLKQLTEQLSLNRLGLGLVIGDWLEILRGKEVELEDVVGRFQAFCGEAIEREVALAPRHQLGRALGRVGDPRIVVDLHDPAAYLDVPAGPYFFGDEQKKFQLQQSFRMTRFPVTNAQYRPFVEDGGYTNRKWWSDEGWQWREKEAVMEPGLWRNPKWNGPNQPVVGVSFWEAEACAKWAGGRLPTEREWEAAARGPRGTKYPWGDAWEDGICNSYETQLRVTTSVGIFPRSRSKPFGFEDLAGNVWQWCDNFYDQKQTGSAGVLRGGCFIDGGAGCRAACRYGVLPASRGYVTGFRIVMVGVRTR